MYFKSLRKISLGNSLCDSKGNEQMSQTSQID